MGASSTHHITVTRQMLTRKKAKRAARNKRKQTLYKGRFGDMKQNRLPDRFVVKKDNHLVKEQTMLSPTEKATLWLVVKATIAVSALLQWLT